MTDIQNIVGSWKKSNQYGAEYVDIHPDGSCSYRESIVVPGEYGYYDDGVPQYGRVLVENGRGVVIWQNGLSYEFQYQRTDNILMLTWADGTEQRFYQAT